MNAAIARRLREAADLLEEQDANVFRVNAYRRAATTLDALSEDLRLIVARGGRRALEELSGIGPGIASAISEMLVTGRWSQLERLRGAADAVTLFASIPGVGQDLARGIHDALGIETLEALETAAYDGRLDSVPGIGPRRLQALRAGLTTALGRLQSRRRTGSEPRPTVAELLAIDAEYRAQAQAGTLKRVAPKRFNPEREAWLPILHAHRGDWYYTALHSNTARAHALGRTRDWVVIYYYDHDHVEDQCTVVTETSGSLKGLRVVRGREPECEEYHADTRGSPKAPRASRAAGISW